MSMGLISETMDLWTTLNLTPFMAVTVHWIQGIYKDTIDGTRLTLKLRSDLIGFQCIPGHHDGKHLATAFIYSILQTMLGSLIRCNIFKL